MKVSKEEQAITEQIFMLNISLSLLKQGRRPFHKEAIEIIKKRISELKQQDNGRNTKTGNTSNDSNSAEGTVRDTCLRQL